jgi:hypothetical protein
MTANPKPQDAEGQLERGVELSPYDPAMEIARRSFRKYAHTYEALARDRADRFERGAQL